MDKRPLPVTKFCPKCRQTKTANGFPRATRGLAGWCKACHCADSKARREDPEQIARYRDRYETDLQFRAKEILKATVKRCRSGKLDYNLDVEWLTQKFQAGRCELTGLGFDFRVVNRRRNSRTPSIDRICAGQGYTKSNCRVVLYAVNVALNDWGLEEFQGIAIALVRRVK